MVELGHSTNHLWFVDEGGSENAGRGVGQGFLDCVVNVADDGPVRRVSRSRDREVKTSSSGNNKDATQAMEKRKRKRKKPGEDKHTSPQDPRK